jgi:hypothetical protein
MWNWLKRRDDRQRDLENGIDADLVGDDRRRWSHALRLWLAGTLLFVVERYLPIPGWAHLSVRFAAVACIILGFFLSKWASQERAFLGKPDPEAPPKLFKS